jgi:hypothetical protein
MDVHCRVCLATHTLDDAGRRRLLHFRCARCNSLHFLRRAEIPSDGAGLDEAGPMSMRPSEVAQLKSSGVYPAASRDTLPDMEVAFDVEAFGLEADDVDAFDVNITDVANDEELEDAPTVRRPLPIPAEAISA